MTADNAQIYSIECNLNVYKTILYELQVLKKSFYCDFLHIQNRKPSGRQEAPYKENSVVFDYNSSTTMSG